MKNNDGTHFEKLTYYIFSQLTKNEVMTSVEHDVMLQGVDGKRQIDILVKSKVAGFDCTTIIECKDYKRKVSIGEIDKFHSKLIDIQGNKGVVVSRYGFSNMAISKAKRLGISLCIVDEFGNQDWINTIDMPVLIKEYEFLNTSIEFDIHNSKKKPENILLNDLMEFRKFKVGEKLFSEVLNERLDNLSFEETSFFENDILKFNNINFPVSIKISNNMFEINDLRLEYKLKKSYYVTSLSNLERVHVLNDLIDNKFNLFVDSVSFQDLKEKLEPIKNGLPTNFTGMTMNVLNKIRF